MGAEIMGYGAHDPKEKEEKVEEMNEFGQIVQEEEIIEEGDSYNI